MKSATERARTTVLSRGISPTSGGATIFSFVFALMLLPAAGAHSQQSEYAAMEGVDSVQQVIDFRVGDPKVALAHLNLIHSMLDDPSMTRDGERPDTVVVFIGPSVKLISEETDVAAKPRAAVADKISAMQADGVRFEICMATAHALDISTDSILPEVVQVENGWISLVGYQHQGYALIAN